MGASGRTAPPSAGMPAAGSGGRDDEAGSGGAGEGEGGKGGSAELAAGAGAGGDAAGAAAGKAGYGTEAGGSGGARVEPEAGAGSGGSAGMQPSAAGAGSGAGGAGAGGAGGMMSMPECDKVGELRCFPGDSRRRERCSDGMWREAEACGQNQICAPGSMPNPASCVAAVDVCRNRNGRSVCDEAGMLYQCGEGGAVRGMMRCPSRELCLPGEMTGECAKCVPGEHRCMGEVLQRCDTAGSGFYEAQRCPSPELCRAQEKRCGEPVCNPGQKTCMGDVLQECKPDRSGFQRLRDCPQGQCDANAGTCRACMPGAARCVGNMLMTCDGQGMREMSMQCPERCDSNRCVDCVGNEQRTCGAKNQGACVFGIQTCRNGEWSECMGNKDPTPEKCNNIDDDCNERIDDNVTDCPNNQMCMNGKCGGCRGPGDCRGQGEMCIEGNCVRPYTTCGDCPAGLSCKHGLCVPPCGNACPPPNLQGFTGYPACDRTVGLNDNVCVLVCQAPGNLIPAMCPQNTTCSEIEDTGFAICQGR